MIYPHYEHMAIYWLVANGSFGPDEIRLMTRAYERALIDLRITNRDDPITELIAKTIVNAVATGDRNPLNINERVIAALGFVRAPAADTYGATLLLENRAGGKAGRHF
jgi:hypothetical protein